MTDPYFAGRKPIWTVPGAGGSEGPWYWDAGCNEVSLPGVNGDRYIIWASEEPTVTGSGDLTGELFSGGMWFLTLTGDGPVLLTGASMLAHFIVTIDSDCA